MQWVWDIIISSLVVKEIKHKLFPGLIQYFQYQYIHFGTKVVTLNEITNISFDKSCIKRDLSGDSNLEEESKKVKDGISGG